MKLEHILILCRKSQWANYRLYQLRWVGGGSISEVLCDLADRDRIMSSLFQKKTVLQNIRLRKENPEDENTQSQP